MMTQYAKFVKMALECKWRGPNAALTYIETSTWTRQEHNGYSHQNPGFISTVLSLPTHLARVYFPADANTATSVIAHCLGSKNYVNLIVGTKAPSPVYLSIEDAEKHCVAGASIWENYSVDKGVDPDVVLVGIGLFVFFPFCLFPLSLPFRHSFQNPLPHPHPPSVLPPRRAVLTLFSPSAR
jgi:xylulose-5-phosphate/fructose-6-phosphate phosphoketolase